MTEMTKKCSTDQRFIQKRNTTYKIHTLLHWRFYLKCLIFFQESESDDFEIETCLTNNDDIFEDEDDNAENQETQSVLETDNEDINAQSVRFFILSKN